MGTFAASLADLLTHRDSVSHIELNAQQVKPETTQVILQALGNTNLARLELTKNNISRECVREIGRALETNSTLRLLTLSINNIGNEGAVSIGRALSVNSSSVTYLDLHGNHIGNEGAQAIGDILATNTALNFLNLSGNYIGNPGAYSIGQGLALNSSLTHLDLCGNEIGHAGLSIGKALTNNSTLAYLDLSENNIANECQIFGKVLAANTSLTHVDLHENNIGGEGGSAIGQALAGNSSLRYLDLSENRIGNAGAQSIQEALHGNSSITHLNVEENGNLPPEALKSITRDIMINQLIEKLHANKSAKKSVPANLDSRDEIEGFLKELITGSEPWHTGKLIFLGHGEVGKTTLLNSVRHVHHKNKSFFTKFFKSEEASAPTKKEYIKGFLFKTARTVGIDQSKLILKDGEISIWDFAGQLEYAVTHQFFLSDEMAVYIVCYDLSQPEEARIQQIAYWLDFIQSTLAPSLDSSKSKWRLILVGTKLDMCNGPRPSDTVVTSWQAKWPKLPIHKHFAISSCTLEGVDKLLQSVEEAFSTIFTEHAVNVPKFYKSLFQSLQVIQEQDSIQPIDALLQHAPPGVTNERFTLAIKYLHAIGRVVVLKDNLICTAPKMIPDIAAKFISPEEVRMKLVSTKQVVILEEDQVGIVLTLCNNTEKLSSELKVMEHIGVCFKLAGTGYLFPSLSKKTDTLSKSIRLKASPQVSLTACRFESPHESIFTPGFFCQFIVALFEKLNISKNELIQVNANCISVSCAGLFVGEMLVAIEDDAKSIVALMRAFKPDLSFVNDVFTLMTQKHSTQYGKSKQRVLCPTCADLSFLQNQYPHDQVGTIETDDAGLVKLVCKQFHEMPIVQAPPRLPLNITLCWTHHLSHHDFFLNYRVATEGKKSSPLSSENAQGLVQVVFEKLSTTKKPDGKSVAVFWDKNCLNLGQDWENGFLHGIQSSTVILLLVSFKAFDGIVKNAPTKQDNLTSISYETAILQNEIHGTPVVPIFVAEMTDDGKFHRFEISKASQLLQDVPHKRSANAQRVIDDLIKELPENKKDLNVVGSIKNTLEKMNGVSLLKRGEDPQELNALVEHAMKTLNWVSVATPPTSR